MKYKGEIVRQSSNGDGTVDITIANVQRPVDAAWRDRAPGVTFRVPSSQADAFRVDRGVSIEIKPK